MKELKQSGVTFAMDDFGTGYSNLAQMVEVAYEFIKLDKTLVWPAFEKDNKKAKILLEEVIDLVQQLGISIIAEGVETKEQAEWLAERHVAHLQGYYFSRPICEQEYLEFMKTNKKAG
jgi:EAL domain-containing protein (putative c-di-GMP-specific phosphodiesterase class I)